MYGLKVGLFEAGWITSRSASYPRGCTCGEHRGRRLGAHVHHQAGLNNPFPLFRILLSAGLSSNLHQIPPPHTHTCSPEAAQQLAVERAAHGRDARPLLHRVRPHQLLVVSGCVHGEVVGKHDGAALDDHEELVGIVVEDRVDLRMGNG